MADRSYFVKLNLDDMAASLDALDSTEERGQWLEGFRVGSRGNAPREGWAQAKSLGHAFGVSCWESANEYRAKQTAKGIASGIARKRTVAEPELNRGSTAAQPRMNQPPNRRSTNQKPETRSQQSTNEDPEPRTQKPVSSANAVDIFSPSMFDQHIPESHLSPPFVDAWHDWVEARKSRKKKISLVAAKKQLAICGSIPVSDAIAMIERSIAGDYQGLFPSRDNASRVATKPKWSGFSSDYYAPAPTVSFI